MNRHTDRLFRKFLDNVPLSSKEELHVRGCPDCQRLRQIAHSVDRRIASAASELATDTLPDEIFGHRSATRRRYVGLVAAVVAVFAIALGVNVSRLAPASSSPMPSRTATPTVPTSASAAPSSTSDTQEKHVSWTTAQEVPDSGTVTDAIDWHGATLAVGWVNDSAGSTGAVWQLDSAQWERIAPDAAFGEVQLFAIGTISDSLVVLGQRPNSCPTRSGCRPETIVWTSTNGRTWDAGDNSGFRDGTAVAATATDLGAVAVGQADDGGHIWFSSTGDDWQDVALQDLAAGSTPRGVAHAGTRYVVVGLTGEGGSASGGVGTKPLSLPSAWWSDDGVTWHAAAVEGVMARGAEMTQVEAFGDGFLATGMDPETDPDVQTAPAVAWYSPDGESWTILGDIGDAVPGDFLAALSDGVLSLAAPSAGADGDPAESWISADGMTWVNAQASSEGSIPATSQSASGKPYVTSLLSVGDVVLAIGEDPQHQGSVVWVIRQEP
jgi:hypothetical protein